MVKREKAQEDEEKIKQEVKVKDKKAWKGGGQKDGNKKG